MMHTCSQDFEGPSTCRSRDVAAAPSSINKEAEH